MFARPLVYIFMVAIADLVEELKAAQRKLVAA
jgi:hypothetical protein